MATASLAIEIAHKAAKALAPPPKLTVSEWADRNRVLSSESAAEPGKWRTARAPYTRGIMDAVTDVLVRRIVFMASAQVGKTEVLNNVVGYFIDQDPSPMLWVMPTVEAAESWSKERLSPMLRDTPCLKDKVQDDTKRKGVAASTVLSKVFNGGHLAMAGANRPTGLASRPRRIVLCDEVDKFPPSAGVEGDPVNLAFKRTTAFWNAKELMTSTPSIEDLSRIEGEYKISDQREFFMPCPQCGELITYVWENFTWAGKASEKDEDHNADSVVYACQKCGGEITEQDKPKMLDAGVWIPQQPWTTLLPGGNIAGFYIWEAYSPFVRWPHIIREYLTKRKHPETYKTFVNSSLGRTYREENQAMEWEVLASRAEEYSHPAPAGVAVITAGVDVQADRLEVEVVGFGRMEESWSLEYKRIFGDTSTSEPWDELDRLLTESRYKHGLGMELPIATVMIDSGYRTIEVYKFVKNKERRRIWAGKGVTGFGRAPVSRPSKNNRGKVQLHPLGVDTIKERVYSCLRIADPGPGYCHTPKSHDSAYYKQLTAEKLVRKYVHGRPVQEFQLPQGQRNEVLDCRVYAYAAMSNLSASTFRMLDREADRLAAQSEEIRKAQEEADGVKHSPPPDGDKPKPTAPQKRLKIRRGDWRP
jgi:phage terminase large subunit GpA-like protein